MFILGLKGVNSQLHLSLSFFLQYLDNAASLRRKLLNTEALAKASNFLIRQNAGLFIVCKGTNEKAGDYETENRIMSVFSISNTPDNIAYHSACSSGRLEQTQSLFCVP